MLQKQLETLGMVYIPICLVGPGLVWHSLVPDLIGPGLARYGASLGYQKTRKRDMLRVFTMSDFINI